MHVDNVLLQIERIGKGFPAVVAEPGLHTPPAVAGVVPGLLIIVVFVRFRGTSFYNELITTTAINLGFHFLFLQFLFNVWC